MARRLFIGIAVQEPDDMSRLPGVWEALKNVSGFVGEPSNHDAPILISDEDGPVTTQRLKDALTDDLLVGRPRITVYFCGHGAFIDGTEVWYLSHGRRNGVNNGEEQINVMAFRDALATYGPKQISFFSDACQTIDTMSGTARQVLNPHAAAFVPPQYDVFRATIRGEAAYASKTDGPLFSKVVSEALNLAPPHDAIGPISGFEQNLLGVSSQSLAAYMHLNLPDYAAFEGVHQQPELLPAFFLQNDYIIVEPSGDQIAEAATDIFKPEPLNASDNNGFTVQSAQTRLASGEGPDEQVVRDRIGHIDSEWRGPFWNRAVDDAGLDAPKVLETYLFGGQEAHSLKNRLHFAGGRSLGGIVSDTDRLTFDLKSFDNFRAGVIAVEDIYVPLPMGVSQQSNMVLNLRLPFDGEEPNSSDGVHFLGWYWRQDPRMRTMLDPWKVLKGLMTGSVNTTAIPLLAADLRFMKHADPIFGITAAYLYDRVGDINSIRRICIYYKSHGQAVPFDIALLARVPFEAAKGEGYTINLPDVPEDTAAREAGLPGYVWNAMSASHVAVAGVVPVLTAGWGRLTTLSSDPRITQFANFREYLQNTPIASFRGHKVGKRLIRHIKEVY